MRDDFKHNWPTIAIVLLLALVQLAGCTYTEVRYGDARLVSWRLWTDTSASLETPELRAGYSSDADTAGAMSMNERLLDALLPARLEAVE